MLQVGPSSVHPQLTGRWSSGLAPNALPPRPGMTFLQVERSARKLWAAWLTKLPLCLAKCLCLSDQYPCPSLRRGGQQAWECCGSQATASSNALMTILLEVSTMQRHFQYYKGLSIDDDSKALSRNLQWANGRAGLPPQSWVHSNRPVTHRPVSYYLLFIVHFLGTSLITLFS